MWDGLQEILFTLRQNKLRTVLTAFGVFWGIFMLVLLLGFGRGMHNCVYTDVVVVVDFGSDVLDFIIVWSDETSAAYHGMGPGRKIQFDESDLAAVRNQVAGIRMISAANGFGNGQVSFANKTSDSPLWGIPDEYFRIKEDVPFNFGRKLNPLDREEIRKVVVIGTSVAERLFDKGIDPVGKDVKVKDVVMKVVGVFLNKRKRSRNSERDLLTL